MKTIKQYQASQHKLQLQLALVAVLLCLPAGLDTGVATAATNSQDALTGAPSANRSRAASRLARLGGGKTNLQSASLAGPTPRPPKQRMVLAEAGPNHRSWIAEPDTSAGAVSNRLGLARQSAAPHVVAIETGMNYWDGQQWSPSDASFDLTEEAFVANRVQHRTWLNADLNVIGAVTTTLVDGTTLRSTPVAIGLYDPNDGRFAVLATVTNSVGVLIATNCVVYSNAFQGSVCANVAYTLHKGSFHQDVVITGRLNPLDYSFPTNAQIQIITEFYDPPQPETLRRPIYVEESEAVRRRMVSPDLMDDVLGFSDLVFGTGRAFTPPSAADTNGTQAVVAKEWRTVPEEGRTFLIEKVCCPLIQKALNALPDCGNGSGTAQLIRGGTTREGYANVPRAGQSTQVKAKPRRSASQLAQANAAARSGVVNDYEQTLGGTLSGTIVFKGDTTYLVEGTVYCNGPVTLEAAVFKYQSGATIKLNNSLTCKTSSYRPAVFTCVDDDTIGESVASVEGSGWTGTINPGGYANPALWSYWQSTPSVSNARFRYAQEALRLEGAYVTGTLANSQIINCIRGIVLVTAAAGTGSGSGGFNLSVNNALLSFVQSALIRSAEYGSGSSVLAYPYLYNCTVDHVQVLANDANSGTFVVQFRNSILANVTNLGNALLTSSTYNGFYASPLFGTTANCWSSQTSPFLTSGAGGYYLKPDSVFRAKGSTTGLPSTLLPSLKTKTTQPAVVFPRFSMLTSDLALSPEVPRYASGAPDLGYWYDALDYTVASMWLLYGSVTVSPGTVVGFRDEFASEDFWPWWWTVEGFELCEGASFISRGMATNPIVYADIQTVQEQTNLATAAFFVPWFLLDDGDTPPPIADFRFSNFYAAPGASPGCAHLPFWEGPPSYTSPGTFYFWSGPDEAGDQLSQNSTVNLTLRDCSFQGGGINLGKDTDRYFIINPPCTVAWTNNLFDRVDVNLDPDYLEFGTIDVDLAFYGYNNLFRNGRLRLVPIAAGTWVFKDNLFDKIAFEQDTTVSLQHDYNGYWRRLPAELETGETDRLTPNAANDKVLTSAPAYQSGPLGSYYLPASGLLYNAGSLTPGQAGLYHYTTRIDQTKDATQAAVNTGLHYVATVSSASTVPKDYDSDGIPDYVENWHGDGRRDWPDETDWQNAQTVSGVADAINPIYDGIDLDGDGMVGRVEKALSRNPLVADNPLTLTQLASPLYPDSITFSVPLNFGLLASAGQPRLRSGDYDVALLANADAGGNCLFTWDTTYLAPGAYLVQAEVCLSGQFPPGAITSATGPLTLASTTSASALYSYPMLPGTTDWNNAAPNNRVASVLIPQAWQNTANSWQLFRSAVASPYFRGVWVVGTSMTASYAAAKNSTVVVLNGIEASTDFGVNCLRYLGSLDLPTMASVACSQSSEPCWLDYIVVSHMAGLDASLSKLDQTSLQRLFALAVWDADFFISNGDTMFATGPVCLMYAVYNLPEASRGAFPVGLALPALTTDQTSELDVGHLPPELVPAPAAAKAVLGLFERP